MACLNPAGLGNNFTYFQGIFEFFFFFIAFVASWDQRKLSDTVDSAHVVESIIGFGKSMGFEMISENVEELVDEHREELITEQLKTVFRNATDDIWRGSDREECTFIRVYGHVIYMA